MTTHFLRDNSAAAEGAVTAKQKRVYQKEAASYVADLILDSLERFPDEERQARVKQVHAALRPKSNKLNQAAERLAEIVLDQMSTLRPEKAKVLREGIRRLAGKKSGSKAAALQRAK